MRLLTATILILSATPWFYQFAFGQVLPSTPGSVTNPVTQFSANGFGYQYDLNGNSTKFYDLGNGMTGYQSRDRNGYVASQGTIYTPFRNNSAADLLDIPPPASHSRDCIGSRSFPSSSR